MSAKILDSLSQFMTNFTAFSAPEIIPNIKAGDYINKPDLMYVRVVFRYFSYPLRRQYK